MSTQSIIFFDGVCNLCNGAVQFVIKRDKGRKFKFASLQSDEARKYLGEKLSSKLNTIVLVQNDQIYTESTAALKISKKLSWPWSWLYIFIFIPKGLRDSIYRFISKNRYKWFGKKDQCMLPTPQQKDRFL